MVEIIEGIIDRRILVNYRMDAEALQRILPEPFRPRQVRGFAMGGICLIRFTKMRPAGFPKFVGTSSENGTHRFCVQWKQDGKVRTGIYVKKRFTNSRLHEFGGDRVFPGSLNLADFEVNESHGKYAVDFRSKEGDFAKVRVKEVETFSKSSIFRSIEDASRDFEQDKIGFSPSRERSTFKGVQLNTTNWNVSPLEAQSVQSSLFSDRKIFPEGSIEIDHCLLMKNIEHNWQDVETLRCE